MHYNNDMTEYIFLRCCMPFFAAALFHLISCIAGKERYADISKVVLMPLLIAGIAAFYFIRFKTDGATAVPLVPVILICAALAAGNAGDIFLLGNVKPATMAKGLCSFLAGHFIYIAVLLFFVPFVPPAPLFTIIAVAVYAGAVYLSRILAGKPRGVLGAGVIVYAGILGTFSLLAFLHLAGLIYTQGHRELIGSLAKLYAGTLLFIASDSILSRTIFVKPFFQSRFAVMSTYISAQFCIAWGFCSLF